MFKKFLLIFAIVAISVVSAKKEIPRLERKLQTVSPVSNLVPVAVPVAVPVGIPIAPIAPPNTATGKAKGKGGSSSVKLAKKSYSSSYRGYRLYQTNARRMQVR